MVFLNDRILIADNSKVIHLFTIILLIFSAAMGISYLFDSSTTDSTLMFYMGFLIVLTSGIAILFMLTRSIKKELYYAEIRQIMLKQNYNGDYIANVKLKRGSIRYIAMNNNRQYFDIFMNKISEHSLRAELRK